MVKKLYTEESGQGMVEYSLIIALIALTGLVVMSSGLAPGISNRLSTSTNKVVEALSH